MTVPLPTFSPHTLMNSIKTQNNVTQLLAGILTPLYDQRWDQVVKSWDFFFFALGKSTEQKWLSLVHFVLHPATRPPCDPCRLLQSHKNEKRRPEGGLKVSLPKRHTKCLLCNADTNISVVLTLPSAATVQTLYVQSVVVCRKSQPSVALSNLKTDCPSMLFLFMHDVSHGKSQRI